MPDQNACTSACVIVLPSLNPDEKFDRVLDGLREAGFRHIVIVDDGSDAGHQLHFERAASFPECTVIHHPRNLGKGRALKDGFRACLERFPDAQGAITIDGDVTIELAFRSTYNVYNILAAYAVCRRAGVESQVCQTVISNYVLKNGRMKTFRLGGHHGTLLTSKHENSIAYDTNLRYVAASKTPCSVLIIVDAVSRKYFTSETSWLWDIDFDLLNVPHVKQIILSGQYCNDLAQRFSFTDLPGDKWSVIPSIPAAAEELKQNGDEGVYVVTCFSDRDKLLTLTEKEG